MIVWKYKIVGKAGTTFTKNCEYAEKKSRLGNIVYCKRDKNIFKFTH